MQERLVEAHLLRGQTLAVDATTLEANAAMRSIVRRDTGESYQQFLTRLAMPRASRRRVARRWPVSTVGARSGRPTPNG